jgi:hypothetical protein
VAPTFVVQSVEELVTLAHRPPVIIADADLVDPTELDELDSIRKLREFVLDTTVDASIYRSAT